jgi:imidazolonepropionase
VTDRREAPPVLVLRHCRQLFTCAGPAPRRGAAQGRLEVVPDGALAMAGDRILFAGPTAGLDPALDIPSTARVVDVPDCSILPGFVDAHTHAVFAGDRRPELRRRLAGESYASIAASGGGIVSTVGATRAAGEDDLVDQSRARLDAMLASGTTTCEIKSGYGLDLESELKMLRAIRRLADTHRLDISATFMGAHEVPIEHRASREHYVDLVVEEMIPQVASARLAEWCDVFCETGVFSPDESRRILEAGLRHGLKPRIHADELGPSGGSQVAAGVGARSADHLIFVPDDGIQAMAGRGVVATLLPAAAFYLKLGRFAPARALIDASVPVALATDVNPGGGFSPSMPFAMTLACFAMHMTFEEALTAATINAAWSLDRAHEVGSLEPGKLADAVVVRGEATDLLHVRHGEPLAIAGVIKRGTIVAGEMTRHEAH